MKGFRTKPIYPKVKLHNHNCIFSKKSNILILRVTYIRQKRAELKDHPSIVGIFRLGNRMCNESKMTKWR